ncbi:CBS domain-containing protein [Zestomonas carbonaria]|uniref:Inosine-5'-monophosphate dehydrogenase n=1 Tax=Zestomonas carbonaria TaxID=2762745 RepID=A0A7U7EKF4_9GAMM|nr:CBS domain-containing protein [Pseudomonas carbonaria]CAD5106575.1 Inosine-5'-monophosphate dehydrogenase [Pseudomonas carbonaria]
MKTVGDILRGKPSSHLYAVGPETSVLEAAELMAEKGIGAVLVLEDGQLAGIVTERDYVRRVVVLERSAYATTVAEIMTRNLFVVGLRDSNQYCMQLMTEKNLRHLPVLEQGELVGLLSIRDLVRDVTSEQENLIEQLQHYIRGD